MFAHIFEDKLAVILSDTALKSDYERLGMEEKFGESKEKLLQTELGIIPSNISFILSCGTGCFFMFAGFYGPFYDRYGCSWGLYIGAILFWIY